MGNVSTLNSYDYLYIMFNPFLMLLMFIVKFVSLYSYTILFCIVADEFEVNFSLYWFKVIIVLNVAEGVAYDFLFYFWKTAHKLPILPISNKNETPYSYPKLKDCTRMLLGTSLCVMIYFNEFEKMEEYYSLLIVYNFWQGWFEGHHLTDYQTSFSHNFLSIVVLLITTKKYKLLFYGFSRSMPLSFNIMKYMLYFITHHKTEERQY